MQFWLILSTWQLQQHQAWFRMVQGITDPQER